MIRLNNVQELLTDVFKNNIEGGYIGKIMDVAFGLLSI